jgi:hypothetical protein
MTIGGPACGLAFCGRPTPHALFRVVPRDGIGRPVRADARGHFVLTLPVGHYVLTMGPNTAIRPKGFSVVSGRTTRVLLRILAG